LMSSIRDELPWRQERLKLAVSSENVGLWEWDLRTGQVYFSPEWKQQIGYENHEIQDSYAEWEPRLHEEDKAAVLSKLSRCLADPLAEYSVEFRLRHKDGSYRWILACASVIRDSDGKAERMLGSHIDITERKRMEQSLRAGEQKYRVLIETMTEGVGVRDKDGRMVYANDALCELCGYSREEIVGRLPSFLLDPSGWENVETRTPRKSGQPHNYELTILRKDGERIQTLVSSVPLFDAEGGLTGAFAVVRDITARKAAEFQL